MTEEKIVEEIKKYVKKKLSDESSGHDFWHTARVLSLAETIAEKEKGANRFIVQLGALLHDISDWKFSGSETSGAEETEKILKKHKVDRKIIDATTHIVRHISYKGGTNKAKLTSEGKIVQDADRLDAIGAIGIARAFAFGGHFGRPIHDPTIMPMSFSSFEDYKKKMHKNTSLNHFYEKLLKLKDLMNTKTAKNMAEKRHKYMEQFLEEFYSEWEAKK